MKDNKPIRVLHVIGVMDRGGAETMIMNLYRELDKNKIQFDFVVHTHKVGIYDDEIKKIGGMIYQCPKFNFKNIIKYKNWWNHFFENEGLNYDIIHGHIGSTAAIYLSCASKKGIATIAHSHNTRKINNLKSILYFIISRRVCGIADNYLACGEKAGRDRFGLKQSFQVLNNAIPAKAYTFDESIRKKMRDEFMLDNCMVLGNVARFEEAKNHEYLIDIFNEVVKQVPAKLMLVGDGTLRPKIEQKVKSLGLEELVIFTGVREDVQDLMQAMDVFVFPSLYEGLPLSIVEAQASGLPCLISDGVPIECKIINLVKQIPLSSNLDVWKKEIVEASSIIRRNTYQEICDSGYDIINNTRKLEEYYRKIVQGEKNICL